MPLLNFLSPEFGAKFQREVVLSYFGRQTNYLITQRIVGRWKLPRQNPARFVRPFRQNSDLWQTDRHGPAKKEKKYLTVCESSFTEIFHDLLMHFANTQTLITHSIISISVCCKFANESVSEFWKSVNICGSHGQEFSVLFFDSRCRSAASRTAIDPGGIVPPPMADNLLKQEAQLSPSDRAMRLVSSSLANYHLTAQKLLIRQVLTKPMVWSWRFSCRQCVMNKPTTVELCISPVYRRLAVAKFSKSTM